MDCKFGMNDFALQSIKRNLVGKMKNLRYGSVFFDEMKITKNVAFNAKTLTLDGYVDFENDFEITKHEGQIADHVLVVGFRSYCASWIQPIALFVEKGATPASTLHEMILKTISALHQHSAEVLSIMCDGAQNNKGLMKLCGCSGK